MRSEVVVGLGDAAHLVQDSAPVLQSALPTVSPTSTLRRASGPFGGGLAVFKLR